MNSGLILAQTTGFHLLDWTVLGLFLAVMVGIIVWVLTQKEETATDYFLAGPNAG